MTKDAIVFIIVLAILSAWMCGIIYVKEESYRRGYEAGANSLSDKHVGEVCIQWLFQSDLEAARRKVCAK